MGTEENKAVVRRFMHELLADGSLGVADEVLAPDYVNVAMGGADRDGVKGMVAATHTPLKGQRFEDEELVAPKGMPSSPGSTISPSPTGA